MRLSDGCPAERINAAGSAAEVVATVVGCGRARDGTPPLGGTATAVATTLVKPVVIVPPTVTPRATIRRVLVPLDRSLATSRAAQAMTDLDASRQLELVILRVMPTVPVPSFEDHRPYEHDALARGFLARYWPWGLDEVVLETRVGRCPELVASCAAELDCDLVVLGWSRTFDDGHADVVRETLRRSLVPVALVPTLGPRRSGAPRGGRPLADGDLRPWATIDVDVMPEVQEVMEVRVSTMTTPLRISPASAVAAVATVVLGLSPAGAVGPYQAVDFGFPGEAWAMNDRGQAVGVGWLAPDAQGFHPFLWEKGRVTDLGVLERGEREYGRATDINEHGLVVGFGVVDQDPEQSGMHAFRWQDGVLTDLGVPGEDSLARAVNNRGQAVGTRYPAGTGAHAVVWHDAIATDLGPGQAFDINDRGQIIGWTPERGATMWYRGRAHDLGAPPGLDDWTPVAINERGWIVGTARVGLFERSYLRRISSFVDLGTLGGSSTSVVGLDDLGDVFGTSETAGPVTGPHPFRWRHGRMTDLSTRGVSAESPVMGVGPRGEILGAVGPPDNVHAGLYR